MIHKGNENLDIQLKIIWFRML